MARPCFKLEKVHPDPVAGVDEAGCAPLAGPVVAAAVILDRSKFPRGIDDSKVLPREAREAIYARLIKVAVCAVGVASVEEIDTLNIYWARMLAIAASSAILPASRYDGSPPTQLNSTKTSTMTPAIVGSICHSRRNM